MIGVLTKPLPHVPRRIGVIGDQGTQFVDEQPPGVRQHDRAHQLERPIATERLERWMEGGTAGVQRRQDDQSSLPYFQKLELFFRPGRIIKNVEARAAALGSHDTLLLYQLEPA